MATTTLLLEFETIRHRWGWLLALGVLMIVLGTIAFFLVPAATLGTVLVLGWLLVVSGIVECIQAIRERKSGGLFMHMVAGIIGLFVGLLVVTHPVAGALAWTLLFASFFIVIGLFRLISAIRLKFPNWGWAVFDGTVTFVLGILLWAEWPWSGIWFIGLAVGISLVFRGWSYVMLALAVHNLPIPVPLPRAA